MYLIRRRIKRIDYRTKKLDIDFAKYIETVKKNKDKKPVILCGDLNVAHLEIDVDNPSTREKLVLQMRKEKVLQKL